MDLIGRTFGRLTVVDLSHRVGAMHFWNCRCECGAVTTIYGGKLLSGNNQSCGCLKHRTWAADMTGQRFGLLTVTGRAGASHNKRAAWTCRCDCGNTAVKQGKYLRNGNTRSCGCIQAAYRASGNYKHGGAPPGLTREYRSWRDAKERCYNPKKRAYRWYGALGVTMCPQWRSDFAVFKRDMGPCPESWTLDRIDPHGHYEPGNCRWASWSVQYVNKRRNTTPRAVASAAGRTAPASPELADPCQPYPPTH